MLQLAGLVWTRAAARDVVLQLNAVNAEVGAPAASGAPAESDWTLLLSQWQDSVVALWTATTRASVFRYSGVRVFRCSECVGSGS